MGDDLLHGLSSIYVVVVFQESFLLVRASCEGATCQLYRIILSTTEDYLVRADPSQDRLASQAVIFPASTPHRLITEKT